MNKATALFVSGVSLVIVGILVLAVTAILFAVLFNLPYLGFIGQLLLVLTVIIMIVIAYAD